MSETTGLTIREPSYLMPAMALAEAIERRNLVVQFVSTIMVDGRDFGKVPGSDKPTLLKPGAEKLTTFFGLTPRFEVIEKVEDWTGADHGGEPFFYYWFRCQLWRGDRLVAEGDGSCNSWETKYRYRQGERKCPKCGKATIRHNNKDDRGGWYCWAKLGGCGAKFPEGDREIENQQVGRVLNPDPADIANTVNKMGQKRSYIAATLPAVNASEFFTQDLEDMDIIDVQPVVKAEPKPATTTPEPASKTVIIEDGKGHGPDAVVVKTAKPNGKGFRIVTSRWQEVAGNLAAKVAYFQAADGTPDWYHMAGAAKKLGFDHVGEDNLDLVIDALTSYAKEHATASQPEPTTEPAA